MADNNDAATAAAAAAQKQQQKETCDGYVKTGLQQNPTLQFLLKNLIDMGCTPPEGFIRCTDCEGNPVSGGFGMLQETAVTTVDTTKNDNNTKKNPSSSTTTITDATTSSSSSSSSSTRRRLRFFGGGSGDKTTTADNINNNNNSNKPDCTKPRQELMNQFQREKDGTSQLSLKPEIYLCQEHVASSNHAHTILAHELIHAIDMCRTTMDPLHNCMQLACTEIRAENLSDECNIGYEVMRGKLNSIFGHGKQCVRRRAIDSVKANPNCTEKAELYVDAVMERCYNDTFPFERHPNQR